MFNFDDFMPAKQSEVNHPTWTKKLANHGYRVIHEPWVRADEEKKAAEGRASGHPRTQT